jgi:hypothetical protein
MTASVMTDKRSGWGRFECVCGVRGDSDNISGYLVSDENISNGNTRDGLWATSFGKREGNRGGKGNVNTATAVALRLATDAWAIETHAALSESEAGIGLGEDGT